MTTSNSVRTSSILTKYLPSPDIIPRVNDKSRRKWKFQKPKEGEGPRTSFDDRTMFIEDDGSDAAFYGRQHEMLHVAFSPRIEFGDSSADFEDRVQSVEDARIQLLAGMNGITIAENPEIPPEFVAVIAATKGKTAAERYGVAVIGTPLEGPTIDVLRDIGLDDVVDTMYNVKKVLLDNLEFESVLSLAKTMTEETEPDSIETDEDADSKSDKNQSKGNSGRQSKSSSSSRNKDKEDSPDDGGSGDEDSNTSETDENNDSGNDSGDEKDEKEPPEDKKEPEKPVKPASKPPEEKKIEIPRHIQEKIDNFKPPERKPPNKPGRKQERKPKASASAEPVKDKGSTREGEVPKDVIPLLPDDLKPECLATSTGDCEWARPYITYPALNIPVRNKGRGPKAYDEGLVPKNMHRLATDQKVFERKRGKRRGSILVDCSGSMRLSKEQIESILEDAPAAIVAGYSGNHNGDSGEIKILAANGFRTDNLRVGRGENEIDGPAVEWLARQKPPRIYVTDQQFTCHKRSTNAYGYNYSGLHFMMKHGPNGTLVPNGAGEKRLTDSLYATVDRARIVIVPSVDDAIEYMKMH